MRPGLWEIILIIVVIIIAIVIARMFRSGRDTSNQDEKSKAVIPAKTSKKKPRSIIRRTGITFIIAGVAIFIAGIVMFRWAIQSYTWSFAIVVIGFIMVMLTRKKG